MCNVAAIKTNTAMILHVNYLPADHWRSSHYAIMHVRNKISNIQGRTREVKVIFHTIRYCS